jgi:hypothetical protein
MSNLYNLFFRESGPSFAREVSMVPGMWGHAQIRLAGLAVEGVADQPVEVRLVWGSSAKCLDASNGNPATTIAVLQSITATSVPAGACHRLVPQGPTSVRVSLHNPFTGALLSGVTSCVVMLEVRIDF